MGIEPAMSHINFIHSRILQDVQDKQDNSYIFKVLKSKSSDLYF